MTTQLRYVGSELELFADATVWKRYWSKRLLRYIGPSVAEVGAGIGTNTRYLNDGSAVKWWCIEPDPRMSAGLRALSADGTLPSNVVADCGVLTDFSAAGLHVDTLLYIDVLEHIEDDRREVETAASCLLPGGYLVVLAPAHQMLFSLLDQSIGHFRRYSKKSLEALTPPSLSVVDSYYLDSVGFFASLLNRFALRSPLPSRWQVRFWDRMLVRASRVIDPLLLHKFGKTVVVVWKRKPDS